MPPPAAAAPFLAEDDAETPRLLPGAERACAWLLACTALAGLLIGGSNLACWWPGPVREWMLGRDAWIMRANTAAGLAAASLSLLLWLGAAPAGFRAGLAKMLGSAVALIGALTSWQYLSGWDLGIDTLLAPGAFPGDRADGVVTHPGRMSFNAALSLFFLGLALAGLEGRIVLGWRARFYPAPALAMIAALPAVLGLVGYVLEVSGFTGLLASTKILFHTAAALFLLAVGTLAARPLRPPMSRVLSAGADGVLLR